MAESDQPAEKELLLVRLRKKASVGAVKLTVHAHQELMEDEFALDDLLNALSDPCLLEDYPQHRRGACCLVLGRSLDGRPMHVVCTTSREVVIIITVYEPKPPKWRTPVERGSST